MTNIGLFNQRVLTCGVKGLHELHLLPCSQVYLSHLRENKCITNFSLSQILVDRRFTYPSQVVELAHFSIISVLYSLFEHF